jgi:hypothetical protein
MWCQVLPFENVGENSFVCKTRLPDYPTVKLVVMLSFITSHLSYSIFKLTNARRIWAFPGLQAHRDSCCSRCHISELYSLMENDTQGHIRFQADHVRRFTFGWNLTSLRLNHSPRSEVWHLSEGIHVVGPNAGKIYAVQNWMVTEKPVFEQPTLY